MKLKPTPVVGSFVSWVFPSYTGDTREHYGIVQKIEGETLHIREFPYYHTVHRLLVTLDGRFGCVHCNGYRKVPPVAQVCSWCGGIENNISHPRSVE